MLNPFLIRLPVGANRAAYSPALFRGLQFSCASLFPDRAREGPFFGRLKEIVGHAEDSVELPDGAPIEALFAHYGSNHPELARFRGSLVASHNQEFAAWSTPLHSGDEVAFLPPVSGG